ncbi:CHAT domain-containing protein [Streptomyces sp. NPDC088727]|uniref:CHAT domain-containing tetratricopeptide repeat protein n=1 Tax=Streptomyces sp. NPDC088727 TaxID=3365875 RepID=UPI00381A83AD
MSDWPLAIGVLGTLVMLFFFCAGDRLIGRASGRTPWGILGFVVSQMVEKGIWLFPGSTPAWYGPSTYVSAMVAGFAGVARLQLTSAEQRANPDNNPLAANEHAAAGEDRLRSYAVSDDLGVLDSAVDDFRTAARQSVGHANHLVHVTGLIRAARMRYERLGRLQDLDEAIEAGGRASRARGAGQARGRMLCQLSTALRLRYDHLGAADDLARAVATGREAVRLVPSRSPHFPGTCGQFGAALHSEFLRTDDMDVLEQAVAQVSAAVDWSDGRGYRRAADRATLCYLLVQRGKRTGDLVDIDRAVRTGREALETIAPGEALYGTCLSNLGLALRTRHGLRAGAEREPATDDLDEAISLSERALSTAPADAPERAVYQFVAALALRDRGQYDTGRAPGGAAGKAGPKASGGAGSTAGDERTGRLDLALDAARAAATHPRADVPTRMRAGLLWSDIAASGARYRDAMTAFETVIALLPRLAGRELRRADQEDRLGRYSGIAADAAACALFEGAPERAVAMLELGRGVLLSRELDLRSDIGELRARKPSLAREFEELRASLTEVRAERPAGDAADARSRRRAEGERWDVLLREIRALDGLADFAGPPSPQRLLAGAAEGAVVYLNVSRFRSDAVIIAPDGIRSVPLRVTPDEAEHRQRTLDAALAAGYGGVAERAAAVHEVLGWLWDALAEPVLNGLKDLHGAHRGPGLPRVWWVPTGSLALLPVHAAGHRGGTRSLLDRVISSYTPTMRSLATARTARTAGAVPAQRRVPLAVTMSSTPGAGPLAGAEAEARMVRGLFPGTVRLTDADATRERVLSALPHHAWAHFACHTATDPDVPSRSGLLLHDHQRQLLTVEDVSRLELGSPELAYLSSCDTARTAPRHADEAIHLASAFQLAGYRQVIATLWRVEDEVSSVFAENVYASLAQAVRSGAPVDAAAAVRRATLAVRELCPNLPQFWASYLHVGC